MMILTLHAERAKKKLWPVLQMEADHNPNGRHRKHWYEMFFKSSQMILINNDCTLSNTSA
jgi:hypothetical protein